MHTYGNPNSHTNKYGDTYTYSHANVHVYGGSHAYIYPNEYSNTYAHTDDTCVIRGTCATPDANTWAYEDPSNLL